MSENFPQISFNPIVEFKAQETGIEIEKVALFFSIMHEELNKLNELMMTRALESGLTFDEITLLLISMAQTTGMVQPALDMIDVETGDSHE